MHVLRFMIKVFSHDSMQRFILYRTEYAYKYISKKKGQVQKIPCGLLNKNVANEKVYLKM